MKEKLKFLKNTEGEELIFNIFEHSFEENCSIAAVNASHFLPCHFFSNKFSKNMSK